MTSPHRIDVHHHILPPRYLKAVGEEAIGRLLVSGKAPAWSPDMSIAVMDRHGIERAYTSMSAPGVAGCAEAEAVEVVRGFNDDAAALRRSSAGRFGAFAFLPLPHVPVALAEIDRVYDTIGTDGIGLLTSYGQRYLGDPLFDPVFAALDRRRAVVFVHPDCGPCSCHIPGVPAATLDFPFDTTRAIVSLMMNGTFARFPGIRFIFSHAGGTVPFLADRLARLERIPANRAVLSEGVLTTLRKLYFDTALSANRFAFASLLQLVDTSRVLFGSDYPFAPEDTTAASVAGLAQLGLDPAQLHAIERGNALAMFDTAA
ncbi:MAG: amidohydrolase family protein [Pseudolabrys sp.]|nr:amidohydrolase family protein [Pseudolabrys sp.]